MGPVVPIHLLHLTLMRKETISQYSVVTLPLMLRAWHTHTPYEPLQRSEPRTVGRRLLSHQPWQDVLQHEEMLIVSLSHRNRRTQTWFLWLSLSILTFHTSICTYLYNSFTALKCEQHCQQMFVAVVNCFSVDSCFQMSPLGLVDL